LGDTGEPIPVKPDRLDELRFEDRELALDVD
jgi:hypothetical protein